MIALQLIFLALLLPVCLIGPGFFFVSRLRWDPLEKLCGSIALSIVILYLASFGIYLANLGAAWFYVVTAACLALAALRARPLMAMLRHPQVRRVLVAYAVLLTWLVGWLAMLRNYSGGGWGADWVEHYQRVLFFLDHYDTGILFTTQGFLLPARPPMTHLVCGHFMAQAGKDFQIFQVTLLCLNSLVFFGGCMIARLVMPQARRAYLLIAAFLALNPMLVQNATYAWPRLMSCFFVLLAISLYLLGWPREDRLRMAAAAAAMSAGLLCHYSAGPYAAFLAFHYLVFVFPQRAGRARELSAMADVTALVLGTWFAWSIGTYGLSATAGSNTPVLDATKLTWQENAGKIAHNFVSTVAPHPLRPRADEDFVFNSVSALGYLRDYMFTIYQHNLIFAMGLVGGPVVLYLLYRMLLRSGAFFRKPEPRFWLVFIVFCVAAGVVVQGSYEWAGLAEVCLQPVVQIGVVLLAASFIVLARPLRWILLAGLAADFVLGIVIHFAVESQVCRLIERVPGGAKLDVPDCMQAGSCVGNWMAKTDAGLTFFGDYFASWQWLLWGVLSAIALFWLGVVVRACLATSAFHPAPDNSGGAAPR